MYGENSCGLLSLQVCLTALDRPIAYSALREMLPTTDQEYNLAELSGVCDSLGVYHRALRWPDAAPDFTLAESTAVVPIVLPDGRRHFVAMLASRNGQVLISDTPRMPAWVSEAELRARWQWDGTALHLAASAANLARLLPRRSSFAGMKWAIPTICLLLTSVLWPRTKRSTEGASRRVAIRLRVRSNCAGGSASARRGLTAIESLVSMAVISVVLAIIVPAVQSARERSRQVQCLNNLRQIGTASLQFEAAHGFLPSYRGRRRDGERGPVKTNLSVQAQLLPFLDQRALFDQINREENGSGLGSDPPGSELNGNLLRIRVPVFLCPTDGLARNGISYRGCAGTTPGVHSTAPASDSSSNSAKMGMFVRFNGTRLSSVRDGLSQTAMFSERLAGDQDHSRFTPDRDVADVSRMPPGNWYFLLPDDVVRACRLVTSTDIRHSSFAGYTWLLGGYPQTLYNHVLAPNSPTPDCGYGYLGHGHGQGAVSARSLHRGAVNVVFGDGAARPVNDGIDLSVWRALGSVRGEEMISDF
ncbi:MAG: DUF1559 domain-containing protein [Planctomycetaceae bacterium]